MEPPAPHREPLAQHLHRYLANLAALYGSDPELARGIDALPFDRTPLLEPTRDGHVTVRLTADDGRPVHAHSRYRPLEEARTLIEQQAQRTPDGDGPEEELESQCFLLSGYGLGYHVVEIERRFTRPLLIVAEDDLGLIKAAFCVTDVSDLIRERRLAFLTSTNKSELHARLRPVMTPLMLGLRMVALPHAKRYHADFQRQVHTLIRDFVAYSRVQMVSLIRNARIVSKNVALNLSAYLAQPGVEVLEGSARGYPAVLVAAGPSLARNVEQLADLRERAVIIGVQTVLKTLLARDMPPHFVTSLDYHEISAQFFRGVEDFAGTILVAEPKVTWHVIDAFEGRTHVLRSDFADDLLRAAAPPRAALRAGSTVAHLAFYLAEHLGCDPIILVGQDLSFSEGLYYPPGMQIERIWAPELGRFSTVEGKQWERIVRGRAGLRVVKDIHGRDTYTDDQLFTYAEQFQADFLASSAQVIHACEGGRRLEGTQVMTLREAGERFCTRPLPKDLFTLPSQSPPADLEQRVSHELEQRMAELREIRQIAVETCELLERLVPLIERPTEFNRLIVRVDELRSRMRRNERTFNLVSRVSQLAELRRVQADRAISTGQRETPATARRRLRRDREYVAAFVEGCDFLLDMLPEALQRVRERL